MNELSRTNQSAAVLPGGIYLIGVSVRDTVQRFMLTVEETNADNGMLTGSLQPLYIPGACASHVTMSMPTVGQNPTVIYGGYDMQSYDLGVISSIEQTMLS